MKVGCSERGGGRESVRRGKRKKAKGERGSGARRRSPEEGEMGSMGGGRMGKEVEVKWNGCA